MSIVRVSWFFTMPTHQEVLVALGDVLRTRRLDLGLTVEEIGAALRISSRRVQSYEQARASMTVPDVFEVAPVLQTDPVAIMRLVSRRIKRVTPPSAAEAELAMLTRFGEEIAQATERIRDERVREAILKLVREIAVRH
jgi:transcriptional regulator with XRE-family HTH domain